TEVERLWEEGNHVLFDIDVQGGLNIKSKYPKQTLAIFVQPPSLEELEKRLRNRGTESEAKIQQRLEKSTSELAYSKDFDVTVINDDLEKAKEEVLRLVQEFVGS
ncbi:guanylate kinase, partial [Flavobacteriaceae bacterium]|nr:guanylate kinase [Flavobacteriaceae bacterium]